MSFINVAKQETLWQIRNTNKSECVHFTTKQQLDLDFILPFLIMYLYSLIQFNYLIHLNEKTKRAA